MKTTWHAVHTAPQMEFECANLLIRQGYRAWYPHCWQTIRRAKETVDVRRPVFVRYIFLGVPEGKGILGAQWTRFVTSIIAVAGEPLEIPARSMQAMMSKCQADGYMPSADDLQALTKWEVGQAVRIKLGTVEGLAAQIAALDGRSQIEVEVEMFGAIRRVKVDESRVEALDPKCGAM